MNCNRGDVVIFKTLTKGYYCIAVGKITNYMYDDHCEVDEVTILKSPNGATLTFGRVGYSDMIKVIPKEYITKTDKILEEFPEVLI